MFCPSAWVQTSLPAGIVSLTHTQCERLAYLITEAFIASSVTRLRHAGSTSIASWATSVSFKLKKFLRSCLYSQQRQCVKSRKPKTSHLDGKLPAANALKEGALGGRLRAPFRPGGTAPVRSIKPSALVGFPLGADT